MKKHRALILPTILLGLFSTNLSHAADFPPQDHQGADLILQDGDMIWGVHENVGRFEVPTSATVYVAPYDGFTTSARGGVEIRAEDIIINGFLSAQGAGYSGGGGGGTGGLARFQTTPGASVLRAVGDAGKGGSGSYDLNSLQGRDGEVYAEFRSFSGTVFSLGGNGAEGDGPFGGITTPNRYFTFGQSGGYAGFQENEDKSTDESTLMGSGASGLAGDGRTDSRSDGRIYGGAAGGNGGGFIRLIAAQELQISSIGSIRADGGLGNYGDSIHIQNDGIDGVDGGDAFPPVIIDKETPDLIVMDIDFSADPPEIRAPGAGGGILIKLESGGTGTIASGSTIASMGGLDIMDDESHNGGTIKIFFDDNLSISESADIRASRILRSDEQDPITYDSNIFDPEGGYVYTADSLVLAARVINNTSFLRPAEDDDFTTAEFVRDSPGFLSYRWMSNSDELTDEIFLYNEDEFLQPVSERIITLSEISDKVSFDPGETWTLRVTPWKDYRRTIRGEPLEVQFYIESETCAQVIGDGEDGFLSINAFVIN